MSIDQQLPPPHGQQGYPGAPAPQQGTSTLAIVGLILAFVVAPVGFILSLIAIFKTGQGKQKGRGLAITGVIISFLIIAGTVTAIVLVANSTVADPGCVKGKQVILDGGSSADQASLQKQVDGLRAAAAEAKKDDVRKAMNALADDYKAMIDGIKSGNFPDGLETKVTADANRIDELCTIGS